MSSLIDAIRGSPMLVGADVNIDEFCEVLANARRRIVIEEIAALQEDEIITLGDLAENLSNHESESERKTVYVSLYQSHVEQLVASGVLSDVPEGANVYTPGRNIEAFAKALEQLEAFVGGGDDE